MYKIAKISKAQSSNIFIDLPPCYLWDTGMPITNSFCWHCRANNTAYAASNTANSVEPMAPIR